MNDLYDKTNPKSILQYARRLLHKTLRDFVETSTIEKIGDSPTGKGGYGTILEEYYFGYKPNSSKKADFEEAGLELK
ncbi:MAG: hypothetical protein NTX91_02825, partial [candidate division SR1 bacterium]|nr:hypothetical protein [candidate division SR1 bacterium]